MSGDGAPEIVLYTAPGCCLCEEAHAVLAPIARDSGCALTVVDISLDAALEARYRARIPVAEIGGRVVFKYRVDFDRLQRVMAAALAAHGRGGRDG